ncbi:MAG: AMP-binding protein [Candidatus Hodarchaeota archaeon]
MVSYSDKFWKKSYDSRIKDFDEKVWETSLPDALRESFDGLPDKMACNFKGVDVTFGELDKYSNQVANTLISNGFEKGDVVAVNLPNIPEYLIAYIAAMKAGCILSGVSPLLSEEQMKYQVNDLGSKGKKVCLVTLDVIFEKRLLKIINEIPQVTTIITCNVGDFLPKIKQILGKAFKIIPKGKVTPLPDKKVLDYQEILKTAPATLPEVKVTPDDLAYIQYTGGTTGPPKGAMLTHRNVMADLLIVKDWLRLQQGKGLAISGFPFFHIAGLFFCECCLFLCWPQILIVDPRDIKYIVSQAKKYKPTFLVNVPSLYQLLLKDPKFRTLDHSRVEVCISSASPFPVESQKELESIVGENKLIEVYGMTECSPLSVMNPRDGKKKLGHIGLPLPNIELKLVVPETGEEAPIGEPGEICVKGPIVMQGYYNKPEETKNAVDKDGFMHTGDVGIMDDEGYIRIVDRTKDMLIVGGFKVFSTKVEDTLTAHPAIDIVALIGIPNPDRPGSEIVKAYVQLNPGFPADGDEEKLKADITAFAKEKCAPYEVPKIIEFKAELPLTTVGKVDKKVLRKEAREKGI